MAVDVQLDRVFCPHCGGRMTDTAAEAAIAARPVRCPACRLLVAGGRSVDEATAQLVRGTGSAAQVLAGSSRRGEGSIVSPEELTEALTTAAASLGVSVARLRMLDYDDLYQRQLVTVPVADVLASHPTWKAACRAAEAYALAS